MLEGVTTALKLLNSKSEIAFLNFVESFKSDETRKKYVYAVDKYIEFLQLKQGRKELALLLDQNPKDIETSLIGYIIKLKKEEYSYSSINTRLSGIIYFFSINDVMLNTKKIYRYLGEHRKTIKDRAYTIEEIKKIVDACDLKYKIIVTMMASTGCRIGAIAALKVSDLKYIKKERLHQILFYTSTRDEYFSFCTPECSKYLLEYLEYRERCGEEIKPESPLVRDDFIQDDLLHIENPRHVTTHTFEFYLRNILIKTGLRKPIPQEYRGSKKRMRKEVSANHGFRKFAHTTMANNKILPETREMLLGHSIGISSAYYKPTEREMLLEYLKVVNQLTINEENRLRRENQELKIKLEDDFRVFAVKLAEVEKRMGIV